MKLKLKLFVSIIIVGVTLFSCSSKLKLYNNTLVKQKAATNYISKDPLIKEFLAKQNVTVDNNVKLDYFVSPSVNYVELVSFASYVKKQKFEKIQICDENINVDNRIFESLLEIDNKFKFPTYLNDQLTNLSTNIDSKLIVFFSQECINILGARILYDRNNERNLLAISYDNPSLDLLFIYNEKNEIQNVFYQEFWP